MRALTFDGTTLRYDPAYPTPDPPPGHALIRVTRAGICSTDLEIVKGYMGFTGVLGHEFAGVVEHVGAFREPPHPPILAASSDFAPLARGADDPLGSAGGGMGVFDDAPFRPGQRVAGEINLACGQCPTCRAGMPTQCPSRTTLGIDRHDGAFAEYLTLPADNLHPLPDAISDEQAVFVEPLAAALQTLHLTHISPHQRVVLIGAGRLGLLTAQVVALTGCDLTVIVRHPRQLDLLTRWGIRAAEQDSIAPHSADVVIDCTGTSEGFAAALGIVRPRGAIHLKSTYHGLPQADLTRAVVDEVQVHTSRCGPFPAAIRLLARGLIDVDALIDARYPLEDGPAAFEHAALRGTLKIILTM
jgi:threonine dehydrogenase-like Zn-dependent dehydrogenase